MKFLKYIILLLCFSACQVEETAPINNNTFTSILIDIHTMDGYSVSQKGTRFENENLRLALGNTVFSKYHINKVIFDSCIQYYSHHIDQYAKIYEVVIDSLNRRSSRIEIILAANAKRDTMNIWTGKDSLSFSGDSLKLYKHEELFKEKGVYVLSMEIKISPKDKGFNNRLVGYIKTKTDSIIALDTVSVKNDTSWQFCLIKKKIDSLDCKSIVFKLMDCDNIDSLKQRDVIIRNIKLLNKILPQEEEKNENLKSDKKSNSHSVFKRKLSSPLHVKERRKHIIKEAEYSKPK